MTRSARALTLLTLFVVPFVAAGCGGSEAESGGSTGEAATEAATDVTITPVGNQMKYEQTEITVPAGEEITLTFENTATSAAMLELGELVDDALGPDPPEGTRS